MLPDGDSKRNPQKPVLGNPIPDKYKYKPMAEALMNHPMRTQYPLSGKPKVKDTTLEEQVYNARP